MLLGFLSYGACLLSLAVTTPYFSLLRLFASACLYQVRLLSYIPADDNRGDRVMVASSLSAVGFTGATLSVGFFCCLWSVLVGCCLFFCWVLVAS